MLIYTYIDAPKPLILRLYLRKSRLFDIVAHVAKVHYNITKLIGGAKTSLCQTLGVEISETMNGALSSLAWL